VRYYAERDSGVENKRGGIEMAFFTAATSAMEVLLRRQAELMAMFTSVKFRSLTEKLDGSIPHQNKAIGDVGAWLKENGIKVPKGVSFSVKPGRIQVKIEVSFTELSRKS